jgi:UDP-N-acetylglucosamine acyltransferase
VSGNTTIGKRCTIYPFASLGHPPQDRRYRGEPVSLVIGDDNIIREYVTMHAGTPDGSQVTTVGSNCFFMVGAHVAHDCKVGNHVILANHATLGGHVEVGDHVFIGGLSAIHQFARIGKHAMVSGAAGIQHSVIPFGMAIGFGASLDGLNFVGLKRRGFSRSAIQTLRRVFSRLFRDSDGTMAERIEQITAEHADSPEVKEVVAFIAENEHSGRALCLPKSRTLVAAGKGAATKSETAQEEPRLSSRTRSGIITEGGQ